MTKRQRRRYRKSARCCGIVSLQIISDGRFDEVRRLVKLYVDHDPANPYVVPIMSQMVKLHVAVGVLGRRIGQSGPCI